MFSGVPEPTGLRWRAWQRLVLAGGWAIVGSGVLCGCGPSFEVLAEGDLRFVHCDRLDLDPEVAPSYRLECWRDWRLSYTYGQTLDRIEYAQRRIAEVVSGDINPPFRLPSGTPVTARHRIQPAAHPSPQLGRLEAPLTDPSASVAQPSANADTASGSASGSGDSASASASGAPARARPALTRGPAAPAVTPAEAAAAARAAPADPVCRSRCEAESSACLPGCESRPRGCEPCAPRLASCLRDCGSDR